MRCLRCHGLMVLEDYWDFEAQCTAWRCINCGSVMDPMIVRHHRCRPEPEKHGKIPYKVIRSIQIKIV